ncbi:MAG: hypothetical protein NZ891_02410, partial [bacterium]|nr:hypothetical protein [bacterium]MDW8163577.1 hypothetical protein [Candidatus Omnitrophota bacterium]
MKELSKRERVERTLIFEDVDRVAIHDQVSYNPEVISFYTGRKINGFNYSLNDICEVIRKTLDMTFPLFPPKGRKRWVEEYGTIYQDDYWSTWVIKSPDIDKEKILNIKKLIGDDTVIC